MKQYLQQVNEFGRDADQRAALTGARIENTWHQPYRAPRVAKGTIVHLGLAICAANAAPKVKWAIRRL